jgi:ferredoxin
MSPHVIAHLVVALAGVAFLGWFAVTAVREHTPRAAIVSALLAVATAILWLGAWRAWREEPLLLWIPNGVVLALTALCFLPLGRRVAITKTGEYERVDERDVAFAREDYVPGTAEYEAYYAMRPANKQVDDRIRRLPELLEPGGRLYEAQASNYTRAVFQTIRRSIDAVDGPLAQPPPELTPAELDPAAMTREIKRYAMQLGADEVGIARLDPDFVYSHVGRGPEPWGAPIETVHRYAIVFGLEMDYDRVRAAPAVALTTESATQYLRGTTISLALAAYIRRLGFPARAQISGSNYQIMLPAVAVDAGLGELARHGYLISRRLGARLRLGAVTTDLELVPDERVAFGVREFCETCRRCATSCPSGSIPDGERVLRNGVERWPLEVESCLHYWRTIGTDCGLCMKVCPYAHPRALVHQVVRAGIERSAFARWISSRGEDLFYGRATRAPRLSQVQGRKPS